MRDLIAAYDRRFAGLYERQRELISKTDETLLYVRTDAQTPTLLPASVGEFVLRSAGAVEQVIGGITTRLWDDPFEWTLPEQLPRRDDVLNYLQEVEENRQRGFGFFNDDDDLNKTLPAPVELRTLRSILDGTLLQEESLMNKASETYLAISPHYTQE
jgi:hypothetical protein